MNHRKIKFKAWDGKKMIHDPILITHNDGVFCEAERVSEFAYDRGATAVVIEYTGIDYNEVEIYEGFLFEGQYGRQDEDERERVVCEVKFERGAFVLFFEYLGRSFEVNDLNDLTNTIRWVSSNSLVGREAYYQIDSMKLIGNKFENPELI